MGVKLTRADVRRLAKHLGLSAAVFTERYVVVEDGEARIRERPCPFLGPDDRCTVYAARPACCRSFPYTDKGGISERTYLHAANARVCPAVFFVVEEMRRMAEEA
jgi:Fe-S-cluster containining protein